MTGKIVLVVVCGLGLCLAAAMALRWGSLRVERKPQQASTPAEPATGNKVVARVLRTLCIGLVGGAVAGVLVGGMGGRLIMRILAATSGAGAQGLQTQADETVGKVTSNGTMGLIIFAGLFFGIAGGLIYVALRRWLPGRAWQ